MKKKGVFTPFLYYLVYYYFMELNYRLQIWKQDFTQPKYSMPVYNNWVVIGNYSNFKSRIRNIIHIINKDINEIIFPSKYWSWVIFEEVMKNSFDTCKDKFLLNSEYNWEINITILINIRNKVITIISIDNWAWINAAKTEEKKYNSNYLWWAWKWLKSLSNANKYPFTLKLDIKWAKFELKEIFQ